MKIDITVCKNARNIVGHYYFRSKAWAYSFSDLKFSKLIYFENYKLILLTYVKDVVLSYIGLNAWMLL